MDRVRVFVNGRAVVEQAVCAPRARVDLDVPLAVGRNRVSVVAYDASGFASSPRSFDVVSSAPGAARPDLWILTVGVSRYKNLAPEHQLDFADDDARSVAAAFADQATRQGWFAKLHPTTLLDEQVTVESVERAVASLAAMKPDDLAVVFFAGHGVRLEDGRMVFLTSTAALTVESARKSGVGWDRINAALGRVRGRVLMLLDACHSGHVSTEVIAPNEALARALAAGGRAGALVFAAARGSQLSYEVPPGSFTGSASRGPSRASSTRGLELAWDDAPALSSGATGGLEGGHGLFTSAVLEALAGGAVDRDRSGAVELAEFVDYVTERVRVASNGRQTPWVARREMFGDFMVAPAKR